jgi:hypothetical protein
MVAFIQPQRKLAHDGVQHVDESQGMLRSDVG